jgi:hypothetical protein
MDSNHNPEADSDKQYDSESSESSEHSGPPSGWSFFNRADSASVKKLNVAPGSVPLLKYRAPSEICKPCRRVIQLISNVQATGSGFGSEYHETYAAVKLSAENGCGICSTFLREFQIQLKDKNKSHKTMKTASLHAIGSSFSWNVAIPWMEGDPTPGVTFLEPCDPEHHYCLTASAESFLAGSQSMMLSPL